MSKILDTFDTFIVDKSNFFALAACRAILKYPSQYYNPLWIYGASACGKTHLLNALSDKLERGQERVVLFLTAEVLVDAMMSKFETNDEAWSLIENADVLIVDNIELLKGMNSMQEEIAALSLKKLADKQQVVLASNCPPVELHVLYRVLREGSRMGLYAEIKLPSAALKRKYIERFMENEPFQITEDAKIFLISNLRTLSQLTGALQTAFFSSLKDGLSIDEAWALNYISKVKE